MKKWHVALMSIALLGACSSEEEKAVKKEQQELEEFAQDINEVLSTPAAEANEEANVVEVTSDGEVLASEEGVHLEWDGKSIELPQDLTEQTYQEDSKGIRWYEQGSPVVHDLYTYNILRIDTNKRMASDLSPYELIPDDGYTQIIIEVLVEHTGNRPSGAMNSFIPRLYSLKDGWEQMDEYRFDQAFRPLEGLNETYYQIIGNTMYGEPRKTDRGDRFITHLIYQVPDELVESDRDWILYQTDGIIGYSATPYSRHLGKLQ